MDCSQLAGITVAGWTAALGATLLSAKLAFLLKEKNKDIARLGTELEQVKQDHEKAVSRIKELEAQLASHSAKPIHYPDGGFT